MEFYNSIAKYYDYIFPLNNSKVNFVNNSLTNDNRGRVLDIGCATGTFAHSLSKHGFNVVGLDLEDYFIDYAKKYESSNLHFILGNMLEIDNMFDDKFDIITCFGNTIVHLDNIKQIEDFFAQSYNLLNDNGVLLLQLVNYNKKLAGLPTIDNDKIKFIRKYETKKNKILFNTELIIKDENISKKNSVELLPIKSNELVELSYKIGFNNVHIYSDFNKNDYYDESNRVVISISK